MEAEPISPRSPCGWSAFQGTAVQEQPCLYPRLSFYMAWGWWRENLRHTCLQLSHNVSSLPKSPCLAASCAFSFQDVLRLCCFLAQMFFSLNHSPGYGMPLIFHDRVQVICQFVLKESFWGSVRAASALWDKTPSLVRWRGDVVGGFGNMKSNQMKSLTLPLSRAMKSLLSDRNLYYPHGT